MEKVCEIRCVFSGTLRAGGGRAYCCRGYIARQSGIQLVSRSRKNAQMFRFEVYILKNRTGGSGGKGYDPGWCASTGGIRE